jgi:Co/Zn/Cd efflux system component
MKINPHILATSIFLLIISGMIVTEVLQQFITFEDLTNEIILYIGTTTMGILLFVSSFEKSKTKTPQD